MLADTLAVMAEVDAERWVCFAPPEARPRMARLAPGCGLLAQVQGDLGDRLAGCFAALLGGGTDRVVVVAADTRTCPGQPTRRRSRCWTRSAWSSAGPRTAATTW
jgi:hypothetical protein